MINTDDMPFVILIKIKTDIGIITIDARFVRSNPNEFVYQSTEGMYEIIIPKNEVE